MKAVILAAGYGTRLQRDIENDTTGNFKQLEGIAKPLLPVGPCALISHWVQALTKTACVDTVYVVTNDLYHDAFQLWAKEFPSVQVITDGTTKNEDRLGAVACLQLVVKLCAVDDHLLVIGGYERHQIEVSKHCCYTVTYFHFFAEILYLKRISAFKNSQRGSLKCNIKTKKAI